jgi:hypothetical protein
MKMLLFVFGVEILHLLTEKYGGELNMNGCYFYSGLRKNNKWTTHFKG